LQGLSETLDSTRLLFDASNPTRLVAQMMHHDQQAQDDAALHGHEQRMVASLRQRGIKVENMASAHVRQQVAALTIQCYARRFAARRELARRRKAVEIAAQVAALWIELFADQNNVYKAEPHDSKREAQRPFR
jgi:hypothetical protein